MDTDYDAIILGAGAAGLAAGLYTTRAMMKTLLIEQLGPGGQLLITDEIDNYPGFPEGVKGQELAMMMEQQTTRFGADIEYTEVQGLDDVDKTRKDGPHRRPRLHRQVPDNRYRRLSQQAGSGRGGRVCRTGRILLRRLRR